MCCIFVFVFKQKTAYEMRISDWSSDVCSSDLPTNERWAICARRIVLPPFSMGALIAGIAVQSDQAKFIFGNRTLVPCIVLEHFPMITQPSILNHRSDLALFLREPPRTVLIVSAGRR